MRVKLELSVRDEEGSGLAGALIAFSKTQEFELTDGKSAPAVWLSRTPSLPRDSTADGRPAGRPARRGEFWHATKFPSRRASMQFAVDLQDQQGD